MESYRQLYQQPGEAQVTQSPEYNHLCVSC